MKRQGLHMLLQMFMIAAWLAVYTVFTDKLFRVKFSIYGTVAYLLMIYLFVLKKTGSNINRRYEIYVEIFGRFSAVNGIWLLFLRAFTSEEKNISRDIVLMIFLAMIDDVSYLAANFFVRQKSDKTDSGRKDLLHIQRRYRKAGKRKSVSK